MRTSHLRICFLSIKIYWCTKWESTEVTKTDKILDSSCNSLTTRWKVTNYNSGSTFTLWKFRVYFEVHLVSLSPRGLIGLNSLFYRKCFQKGHTIATQLSQFANIEWHVNLCIKIYGFKCIKIIILVITLLSGMSIPDLMVFDHENLFWVRTK